MARNPPSWLPRHWALLCLALVLLATAAARLKSIDIPLERDEGEYAYGGQLLLRGIPPYSLAYNMKFPGIYAAYAAMLAIFGESTRGIHLGLLLVNAASILLVYVLGTWLSGRLAGVTAAASYALLSASPSVLGLAAHATHFIVLTGLVGGWLLVRARDRDGLGTLVAGGFALGLALLMKQHAVFLRDLRARAGPVVFARRPRALMGRGPGASRLTLAEGWPSFLQSFPRAEGSALPLWLLAGAGLIATWLQRDRRDRALWIAAFALCSFAATIPGFWFREHYFIVLLPAVAMLAGAGIVGLHQILSRTSMPAAWSHALCALVFVLASAPAAGSLRTLLAMTPDGMSRAMYGASLFPESVEIARHIAANSGPDARIAVLGSEPQIYFHADPPLRDRIHSG